MPLIESIRRNNRIFIETGTYLGDGIRWALSKNYKDIHSIELTRTYYDRATIKFADYDSVHLVYGDSSTELCSVLAQYNESCDIWLDGHFMKQDIIQVLEIPKDKQNEGPILSELAQIKKHSCQGQHTIMIDDMRGFAKKPKLFRSINEIVLGINNNYHIEYLNNRNILRAEPL